MIETSVSSPLWHGRTTWVSHPICSGSDPFLPHKSQIAGALQQSPIKCVPFSRLVFCVGEGLVSRPHLLGEVAQGILLLNLVDVEGLQELLEVDEE